MMRFQWGVPPRAPEFQPEVEGWISIRALSPIALHLLAIPVGIALVGFLCYIIMLILPAQQGEVEAGLPWLLFAFLISIILLHELIHAMGCPGFSRFSPLIIFGLWPTKLVPLPYVYYAGPIPRQRYLLVLAAPFMILSLLPIGLMGLLRVISVEVNFEIALRIAFVSVVNGALAGGDVLGFILILFQVPASAIIRNHGLRTFWKLETTEPQQDS